MLSQPSAQARSLAPVDVGDRVAEGKAPEDVVGMLAEKTPSGAVPNVYHHHLLDADLLGYEIEMTGQAVIGAGDVMKAPDGSAGLKRAAPTSSVLVAATY